jgi:hypothetical protein
MADKDDRFGLPIDQIGNGPRPDIERDGGERCRILPHSGRIWRQHAMPLLFQQWRHPFPTPRAVPDTVHQDKGGHSFLPGADRRRRRQRRSGVHAKAGVHIGQAAELDSDRVAALVYITAFMVLHGASLWSTMQLLPRDPARPPDLVMSDDWTISTLLPQAVRNTFYITTDEVWALRAATLVCAEPMARWLAPLALSDDGFGRVPRVYIESRWRCNG